MNKLYHGSANPNITVLNANSKLHNNDKNVVYLTDSVPYALIYIWDENLIGFSGKHVTGWVKNGIVYYEEQFPDQLKHFYDGASGYLYHVDMTSDFHPVNDRECMFYSCQNAPVTKAQLITNVYNELLKYEKDGKFKLLRYNEQTQQRQSELTDIIASSIIKASYYENNLPRANFMKKYFSTAWEKAVQQKP